MRYWLNSLTLYLFLIPIQGLADSRNHGLAIHCFEGARYFSVEGMTYDANLGLIQDEGGLFSNQTNPDEPNASLLVAQCKMGQTIVKLERVFLHTPSARGACGGADWAQFELSYNGTLIAEFYSGCGPLSIRVDDIGFHLCGSAGTGTDASGCGRIYWRELSESNFTPIKTDLFGEVSR